MLTSATGNGYQRQRPSAKLYRRALQSDRKREIAEEAGLRELTHGEVLPHGTMIVPQHRDALQVLTQPPVHGGDRSERKHEAQCRGSSDPQIRK